MEKLSLYPGNAAALTPNVQSDAALAQNNTPQAALPQTQVEKERTPGLKLFDFLLYPLFTNIGVFGISVAATYLTTRGGDKNAAGKLVYGSMGNWFHTRGTSLVNTFKSWGMTHNQADMSKMVFFSFFDGSLLSPFVKLFEDRREKIACQIDHKLGTRPDDLSVYEAEPKQTWLSVIGGRLATASIVVPTAVALDKTGLNDALFSKPGMKMGEWLSKKPGVVKMFGKLDVKEISRIALFEAFYTSVCTGGLYFLSRWFAKKGEAKKIEPCSADAAPAIANTESAQHQPQNYCGYTDKEPAKINAYERLKRPLETRKSAGSFREKYLMEMPNQHSFAAI